MDSSDKICSSADLPGAYNALSMKFAQEFSVTGNVPEHTFFAFVSQMSQTSLQHGIGDNHNCEQVEAKNHSVTIMTRHHDSGPRLFAGQTICKNKADRFCFRPLVHAHLTKQRHYTKTYGERVVLVTAETFLRWANEVLEIVTNKERPENYYLLVSIAFNTMR